MYCRYCGKQIADGSTFCSFCGHQQNKQAQNIEPQQTKFTTPIHPVKKKNPIYKRWWFWFICAVIIIIIIGNSRGNSSENSSTTPRTTATAGPTSTPRQTSTPKPTATPTPPPDQTTEPTQEVIYAIGDTVEFDGLEITITDIKFSQYAGNLNGLNKATDGLMYCVLYVNVKNTDSSARRFDGGLLSDNKWDKYTFKLIANGENTYLSSWASYTDFLFSNDSIPAQATLTGKVINYGVPAEMQNDSSTIELELSYNSWKDGSVKWSLR